MQSIKNKSTTKTDRICGIYRITSPKQKGAYIGQSANVYARWNHHKTDLKEGYHVNDRLRELYRLHGIETFKFEILEQCPKESLDSRELFWIAQEGTWNKSPNQSIAKQLIGKSSNGKIKPRRSLFDRIFWAIAAAFLWAVIAAFMGWQIAPIAIVGGVIGWST